ncbi:pantoate kinase [Geoglobus acetivorans]|uniref:Pantoate kinase n=1 Tax=Geoglobus acetivorans TaxID=565033 RepID=A0ABZ3H5R8_GEOAI|nr:GHMP kinase [Geoglobus acetivorans]
MTFVSASITAFFSSKISDSPETTGSYGVGFTIDKGVRAEISEKEGVYLNGERVDFPTVSYVLEKLGGRGVELFSDVPISSGFGVSGASALATAIEVSMGKNLGHSFLELADLAHEAEVVNLTGLGDVVTQSHGGIVVRISPGCPSRAKVVRYLHRADVKFLVMGTLPTRDILSDEIKRKNINRLGKSLLKDFLKKPLMDCVFELSKKFAVESGLADEDVIDAIEAVESAGGKAGMVMLGKTVFAMDDSGVLEEFRGETFTARIASCGLSV